MKKILIECYESGKTMKESADTAGIKYSTSRTIIHKFIKDNNSLIEKSRGGKRFVKITSEILKEIEKLVEENPSITLREIRDKILTNNHVNLSLSAICNCAVKFKKHPKLQITR